MRAYAFSVHFVPESILCNESNLKRCIGNNHTSEAHGHFSSSSSASPAQICMCTTRERANVCENRVQLGRPKVLGEKESERKRCEMYRKIKAKLYIIKVYRKPLKKYTTAYVCFRCCSIEFKIPATIRTWQQRNYATYTLNPSTCIRCSFFFSFFLFRETRKVKIHRIRLSF